MSTARKRVTVACTACRTKRIRCDGQTPECGNCLRQGKQCEYLYEAEKRKPPSKRYVDALHARIEILEKQLREVQSAQNSGFPLTTNDWSQQPISSTNGANRNQSSPPQGPTSGDPVDELTELYGRLDVAEDGHLRYFGAPSYFNLLRESQFRATDSSSSTHPLGNSLSAESLSIPIDTGLSPELEDHLLELYWKWQNPWQYLIHQSLFCEALKHRAYTGYVTPLLLQCVLALSARYSDRVELRTSPEDPNSAGDDLERVAKALLQSEIEHPTTSTVAALAILALREMSVNKEALGWTYIGIAIRIAYNLGLNHNCVKWIQQGKISETEAETRSITWWGCFLLDKLFMVGLGRPGLIQDRHITIQKPSLLNDAEYASWALDEHGVQPCFSASRLVSNVRYTCEIFQIASDTLEEIYAPNSTLDRSRKEELALETYLKMTELYNNLPSFLRMPPSSKTAVPPHVYSLHLQYHVIIILLHRPFLRRPQTSNLPSVPFSSVDLSHNSVCIGSAEAITSALRSYRLHYTLRRIPISTVHAVGTASVIHLLGATLDDPTISKRAIRHLRFNITCLEEMSVAWNWSLRAIKSIQVLADQWAIKERLRGDNHELSSSTVAADDISHQAIEVDIFDFAAVPSSEDPFEAMNWMFDFGSPTILQPLDTTEFDDEFQYFG